MMQVCSPGGGTPSSANMAFQCSSLSSSEAASSRDRSPSYFSFSRPRTKCVHLLLPTGGQLVEFFCPQDVGQILGAPAEILVRLLAKQSAFEAIQRAATRDPRSLLLRILRADRPHRAARSSQFRQHFRAGRDALEQPGCQFARIVVEIVAVPGTRRTAECGRQMCRRSDLSPRMLPLDQTTDGPQHVRSAVPLIKVAVGGDIVPRIIGPFEPLFVQATPIE